MRGCSPSNDRFPRCNHRVFERHKQRTWVKRLISARFARTIHAAPANVRFVPIAAIVAESCRRLDEWRLLDG